METNSWTLFDVIAAAVLIAGLIGGLAFANKKAASKRQKIAGYALVLFIFIFFWAELAVGLIGTPFAGN